MDLQTDLIFAFVHTGKGHLRFYPGIKKSYLTHVILGRQLRVVHLLYWNSHDSSQVTSWLC